MALTAQPKPVRAALPQRPELRVVATRRRVLRLHLVTYLIGNALFWTLWAAISVTTDHWYWWPAVPFAGWGLVLAVHLWSALRSGPRSAR